ncbi:MAG: penicillin-binding protein 1B [Gammaproteobacteria bacterium]
MWLDHHIQDKFEGRRWSLPARVYAGPLEIYPGLTLSISRLERELLSTGFVQHAHLNHSGQYRRSHHALEFVKRPFRFWDGKEQRASIHVSFDGDRISSMRDNRTGKPLSVVRLEPRLIGKIYPAHNEDRVLLSSDETPAFLLKTLVAVEDRSFYHHFGIDFRGILRALFMDIRQGGFSQGGSTLTQQLVKNYFLSPHRTFRRKFNEMIMAVLLELHYSKNEILSAYINEVYLGQHGARSIHGFGTAAEFYFGRPLNELRIEHIALLVGLVRGASYYNPRRHPQRALERRNLVLRLLHDQGYLSKEETTLAQSRPLGVTGKPTWGRAKYPAFLDLVRRQLLRDYKMKDLRNEGLRIFTTLEPDIQDTVEHIAGKKLRELEKRKGVKLNSLQMASVILRIGTGEVLAVIGGRDRQLDGFNRALDAKRPIGSLIKPAIYLTALSRPDRYNLLTLIDDTPVAVRQKDGALWQPRNYDRKPHGKVLLGDALKHSYNLASVRLGLDVGLDKVISTLHKTGIDAAIKAYPSLLLGSLELAPIEVAQMYQTLANGGFQVPVNTIRAVLDRYNRPVQRYGIEVRQTLDPVPVFLLDFLLTEVVRDGTARALNQSMRGRQPLAGKTGTTNDLRDSWYAGFGDELLAVTWMGRDDDQPTRFTGSSGALQLWSAMMNAIQLQPLQLRAPEGIKWLNILNKTGGKHCPDQKAIPYNGSYESIALTDCF